MYLKSEENNVVEADYFFGARANNKDGKPMNLTKLFRKERFKLTEP